MDPDIADRALSYSGARLGERRLIARSDRSRDILLRSSPIKALQVDCSNRWTPRQDDHWFPKRRLEDTTRRLEDPPQTGREGRAGEDTTCACGGEGSH